MKYILSIDGGGIRGIIPATVLARIEAATGKPTADLFDLIAGTSTGGILALGLSLKNGEGTPAYTAQDLMDLYQQNGRRIFNRSFWHGMSSVGGLNDERYQHKGLEEVLETYFGDALLSEAATNVLVTSYDIQNRKPVFFKSWRSEYSSIRMRDVARATSAAPTFFEPALVSVDGSMQALIDGGVFINSPSVSAFAEAKRIFPDEQEFFLLSLGTGELTRPIGYNEAKDWGKVGWLLPLFSCMFDGVADAADYQMRMFLDKRYVRLQTSLTIASDDMDDASNGNLTNLKAEATKLLRSNKAAIERVCGLLNTGTA